MANDAISENVLLKGEHHDFINVQTPKADKKSETKQKNECH